MPIVYEWFPELSFDSEADALRTIRKLKRQHKGYAPLGILHDIGIGKFIIIQKVKFA